MYKLTAMDSVTGHVYDFCVATKDEFNQEFVKNFLKPLVDEFNINVVVTDGDNMYPAVLDELGVEHKLCGFHIMQTVCKKLIGKIRGYNKKIKNLKDKILKNEVKIKEISELRAGKIGRPSKEEQALIDEKNNLKRENHQNKEKIVKLTNELKEYEDAKDYVSDMIKPKSKQAGRNRCTRFVNIVDERPKELRGFINNLPNKIEQILLHTEYDDVPTTNNIIELYHLTTLNRHDKKKYKTIDGVMEETLLKTLRWEKRVVLGIC